MGFLPDDCYTVKTVTAEQKRRHSLLEAVSSTFIAFFLSYAINLVVFPWFKREMSDHEAAFWITVMFSVVSIVRGYFIRRLFNWLHVRSLKP